MSDYIKIVDGESKNPLENVPLASDGAPSCPKCRALAALEHGEGNEWACRVCGETTEG